MKAHCQDLLIFEISMHPASCMHLKSDFLAIPKKALHKSHTITENIMIRITCFSFVRWMNKMLTGLLRLISTPYTNSTCEKDLICSFIFYLWWRSYNKKKKICMWTFCRNWCSIFALHSSYSSVMYLYSSLVALMAVSFSPPLMKIVSVLLILAVSFMNMWLKRLCGCNKLQGCP